MFDPEIVEALRRATAQALELGHRLGRAGTSLHQVQQGASAYQRAQSYAELIVLPVVERRAVARVQAQGGVR